ncbi:MAG: TonB-dependent receptor [Lentimicrobiaceae bacterium]|jgi:TonB-linked SusC/RagA family outer membrane protein
MKKKLLLSTFFLFFSFWAWSQQVQISGTVKSTTDNLPLPGASVVIKGTVTGTTTDIDGKYSLKASPNQVLVFSFIGLEPQEVTITASSKIVDILLVQVASTLQEVVVVGYGTQRITKVSGAISTVKAKDIERQKPIRVEEALQGRASGVSVIQNGSPGSKPTVLIRGIPSFSGTDPVVIIDGIPQTLDDLNAINSADIESFNVLKDAAATAIYGVKGGNGVIVVTTKSGKKNQKAEFSFSSNFGQQKVLNKIGVLNASEYAAIINEGSVTSGGPLIFTDISGLGVGTDWQDQVFKTAGVSSNNFTATGGGEKVSYFLSAGYMAQGGIVGGADKSNFNRANVTANFDVELTKRLKLILNTSYANIASKGVQENSFNSIIGSALNFDPTVEVLNTVPNTVGTYGFSNLLLSEIFNPLTKLENTYNESFGNKLFGKAELQYDVMKNLKLSTRFGYVKWDQVGKSFNPLVFYGPLNVENTMSADGNAVYTENWDGTKTVKHNSVSEYQNSNFNYTYEAFANYSFNVQEKHNFDVVAGFSMAKSTSNGFNVSREDVPYNSWDFADISGATGSNVIISAGGVDPITNEVHPPIVNFNGQTGSSWKGLTRKNLSYFGRLNYDYEGKYLASFSARRDGSIAFGPANKFADFFAGSLGWVVSNEEFFHVDFINNLKIRGSYGSIGNENVSPQYVAIVTGGPSYNQTANSNGYTFGSTFLNGSTVNSFKNDKLAWEKQNQLNAGFDMSILKNNLSLSVDYFQKKVNGLLFTLASPFYAGTSLPVDANIGSTKSSGIDLSLSFNTELISGFLFNTSATFTTSKNLVTETNSDGTQFYTGGGYFNGQSQTVTRFQKGFTPGYFYGYKTDGLFQTVEEIAASATQAGAVPGDIKFVDISGPDGVPDGIISDLDKTKIGDPFPTFTLGWNLGLEYKNFDFNVFTYASVGNDVYRAYERNAQYSNKFRSILGRWTGPGSTNDANTPRYSFTDANSNIRVSDRYVEDGSFVKIKNILIGYTIPTSLHKNKVFTKLRVYIQAKNLYTFTKYTGYDPEIPGGILDTGVDRGNYPQARTFSAGLDLKF